MDFPANYADMESVRLMAMALESAKLRVTSAEAQLAGTKRDLAQLAEHDMPELLDSIGWEGCTAGGHTYVVKDKTRANISKERSVEALQWLRDHGHGGLIKSVITVSLGRNKLVHAQHLSELIARFGFAHSFTQKVDTSTLCVFAREQLEAGSDFPLELFGVYQQRTVEVKK